MAKDRKRQGGGSRSRPQAKGGGAKPPRARAAKPARAKRSASAPRKVRSAAGAQRRRTGEPHYPDIQRRRLEPLAAWVTTRAGVGWREAAVNPERLEAELATYPGLNHPRTGLREKEIKFCLGWAELAQDQFVKQQPNSQLNDKALCAAIDRAAKRKGGWVRAG